MTGNGDSNAPLNFLIFSQFIETYFSQFMFEILAIVRTT